MPYYDYQCPKCEKIKEEFHLMKETPDIFCDTCKKVKMQKVLSTPQISMGEHPGTGLHEVE